MVSRFLARNEHEEAVGEERKKLLSGNKKKNLSRFDLYDDTHVFRKSNDNFSALEVRTKASSSSSSSSDPKARRIPKWLRLILLSSVNNKEVPLPSPTDEPRREEMPQKPNRGFFPRYYDMKVRCFDVAYISFALLLLLIGLRFYRSLSVQGICANNSFPICFATISSTDVTKYRL